MMAVLQIKILNINNEKANNILQYLYKWLELV